MVVAKKTEADWQSADAIKTLTQMHAHIENCKEWLTSSNIQRDEDVNIIQFATKDILDIAKNAEMTTVPNIGVLREDIPPVGLFDCFMCKTRTSVANSRIITANPFTRAQCMLLCQDCVG